jgi:hypothetical protein
MHPNELEKNGHKFIGANGLYGSALLGDTKDVNVKD